MKLKKRCREELHVVVDTPKQGYGKTNTGNTARRTLESAEIFGNILEVDEEVIIRLRNILKAVCSGFELGPKKFKPYCFET